MTNVWLAVLGLCVFASVWRWTSYRLKWQQGEYEREREKAKIRVSRLDSLQVRVEKAEAQLLAQQDKINGLNIKMRGR